jgi:hypothetical protein
MSSRKSSPTPIASLRSSSKSAADQPQQPGSPTTSATPSISSAAPSTPLPISATTTTTTSLSDEQGRDRSQYILELADFKLNDLHPIRQRLYLIELKQHQRKLLQDSDAVQVMEQRRKTVSKKCMCL